MYKWSKHFEALPAGKKRRVKKDKKGSDKETMKMQGAEEGGVAVANPIKDKPLTPETSAERNGANPIRTIPVV